MTGWLTVDGQWFMNRISFMRRNPFINHEPSTINHYGYIRFVKYAG
jgi:hypothetical protein